MLDTKDKAVMIQNIFFEKLEEYGWPSIAELVKDKYFFRGIYYSLVKSNAQKKNVPPLSEIFNPFKLSPQENLKIVIIDTVNKKDILAKTGLSLASLGLNLNKKGISFLDAINNYKYKGRGIMDKRFTSYQGQGMLLLQLPFTRPIDEKSRSKNVKLWNMVPKRMIRTLSDLDRDLIFIFFTNELNYLKKEINPNSRIYDFEYKKRSDSLAVRRIRNAKNKKMLKEIDQHINKHYKTKIKW